MNFDVVSYLMGKAAGGGGSGGSDQPAIWVGGYEGGGSAGSMYSRILRITGWNGKYALITFMTRSDLTVIPSGAVQLDKSSLSDIGIDQSIYVFKYQVTTDDVMLEFGSNVNDRKSASWWLLDRDFSITKTVTSELFEYFNTSYSLVTKENTFITFSAANAQSDQSNRVWAYSDGAWINQPFPIDYQLRHFSGIIPGSKSEKITKITQKNSSNIVTMPATLGQVVAYTITV